MTWSVRNVPYGWVTLAAAMVTSYRISSLQQETTATKLNPTIQLEQVQKQVDILYGYDDELIRREYIDHKPFVLRDVASKWPAMQWNYEYIKEHCGDTVAWAYNYQRGPASQPYVVQAGTRRRSMTIAQFFEDHFEKDNGEGDWSIKECRDVFEDHPDMLDDLKFDEVYAGPEDFTHTDHTEYFWVGTSNSSIGLHADLVEWNMQFMIIGTKHWKLFDPKDEQYLYVETKTTVDGGLYANVDPFAPDFVKYPEFARAIEYDFLLQPGDLIYVPKRWWHSVYSRTTTLSVTCAVGEEDFSDLAGYLEVARLGVKHQGEKLISSIRNLVVSEEKPAHSLAREY